MEYEKELKFWGLSTMYGHARVIDIMPLIMHQSSTYTISYTSFKEPKFLLDVTR